MKYIFVAGDKSFSIALQWNLDYTAVYSKFHCYVFFGKLFPISFSPPKFQIPNPLSGQKCRDAPQVRPIRESNWISRWIYWYSSIYVHFSKCAFGRTCIRTHLGVRPYVFVNIYKKASIRGGKVRSHPLKSAHFSGYCIETVFRRYFQ